MRKSPPQQSLRTLLRDVFREGNRGPHLTLSVLREHWTAIVGSELAERTVPHRLDRGTLWIAASDASWAYELQFFKSELLNSVHAFLESPGVQDLRFIAGPVDPPAQRTAHRASPDASSSSAPSEPQLPDPPIIAEDHSLPHELARSASRIGDAALRDVFQRSLAKQRLARENRRADSEGRHRDDDPRR